MSGPRAPIALAAASLALLCGCGHTSVVGGDRTLQIALTEYRVLPQSIRAGAGPMTIFVHNYGRLTHNLVISRGGQAQVSTRPIWPGQTAEITVTLTPGKYLMASTILSDQALGTFGTLTVGS